MKKEILVVLGSPNSEKGELSNISKSRLNYCLKNYSEGKQVLCTGGWGDHFNTSNKPHAEYCKAYLIKNGVLENAFLDFAISSNTVDDAVKIKPIIQNIENSCFTVITSDYHVERVKLIFEEILSGYEISCIGVKSDLDIEAFTLLEKHEKKAIQSILDNGLYY